MRGGVEGGGGRVQTEICTCPILPLNGPFAVERHWRVRIKEAAWSESRFEVHRRKFRKKAEWSERRRRKLNDVHILNENSSQAGEITMEMCRVPGELTQLY